MAKMFYNINEAAEKLGLSVDEVKKMADTGKLQQFRDRDNVMFKVDQIDKLAAAGSGDSAVMKQPNTAAGDTDAIDLAEAVDVDHEKPKRRDDTRGATGISVFDADEIDAADPMAQTVVSGSMAGEEDEIALEAVGSGSGLLDLTRESDDTSLGAELLEEIYPAGGSDAKMEGGSGFEGIFDAAGGVDSAPSSLSDVETTGVPSEVAPTTMVAAETVDPAASGWTGGLMLGAFVALVLAAFVVVTTMGGTIAALTTKLAENLPMYAGGLLVVAIIFAVIGLFVGKAAGK